MTCCGAEVVKLNQIITDIAIKTSNFHHIFVFFNSLSFGVTNYTAQK